MLQEVFIALVKNYTTDESKCKALWHEIEERYSNKKRHYHNLTHLENLLQQLLPIKDEIKEWHTVLFSIFYHDVIYNTLKRDNEEKSAAFAATCLESITVPQPMIDNCIQQIHATKAHNAGADTDTNYFIDADLSIVGMPWDVYAMYYKNVRKEYALYPDLIYVPGRKKVLQHFLQMERLFKTDFFYNKFEIQAKENLQQELNAL